MSDHDRARAARHAIIDEECRRISVWVGIQAAAWRAQLAGKSYTRSHGQLVRWRQPQLGGNTHGNERADEFALV